jgi:hypothetical protein
MSNLSVQEHNNTLVVDSRLIAERLGIEWELLEHLIFDLWKSPVERLTVWDLLALWQNASHKDINLPAMSEIIDEFYPYLAPQERITFSRLNLAVVSEIAWTMQCRESELGRVHSWFSRNAHAFIDGGKLRKVESIKGKRPDFLVEQGGTVYPVECKLFFNKTALKQLQGYMKLWNVSRGYAVAPKLVCSLPKSVVFIKCP